MMLNRTAKEFQDLKAKIVAGYNPAPDLYRKYYMKDCPQVGQEKSIATPHLLCREIVSFLPALEKPKVLVLITPEFVFEVRKAFPFADITFVHGSQQLQQIGFDNKTNFNTKTICVNVDNASLREVQNMKFDFVVGNPPYQDPVAKSSKKLWPEFFKKSFDLCKDNGYVALITPNSWQTPSSDLFEYFQKYQCKVVCLDGKEHFPNVGTSITWYVIKKEKGGKETKIVNSLNEINFSQLDFLPRDPNPLTLSIISKLFSFSSLEIKTDSFCHSQNEKTFESKNEEFKFPIKHGNNTIFYSKEPHPTQFNKKVMFHKSGNLINPIIDNGILGPSEDILYKEVKSIEESKYLCLYLQSKIICFLMNQTTYSMNMSKKIIKKIPAIDLSRQWTDEQLYELFNLTKEEIAHVESSKPKPKQRKQK